MSDQIPNAEEQIPSVEEIFQNLEGHPPEEQVPVLAAIVQALVGQLADVDARLSELDQKFHGEIYGPLKDSYQAKIRGQGLQSMKQKYGSLFDPILEPLKGFGIDDPYSTLYDMLEGMKKDGTYKEEDEATYIGDQHKEAMKRIGAIRGEPPAEEAAKEEFMHYFLKMAKERVVGCAYDPRTEVGPVVSAEHKQFVLNWINKAEQEGARLLLDGRNVKVPGFEKGYFVGPTIFDNVTETMTCGQEEVFGPVSFVKTCKNFEEGITIMNNSPFANGSAIFTESGY